jgi:hypothetical protein
MHTPGFPCFDAVERLIRDGLRAISLTVLGVACFAIVDHALPEKGLSAKGLRPGLIDQDQLEGPVWSLAFSDENSHLASATLAGEVTCKDLTTIPFSSCRRERCSPTHWRRSGRRPRRPAHSCSG